MATLSYMSHQCQILGPGPSGLEDLLQQLLHVERALQGVGAGHPAVLGELAAAEGRFTTFKLPEGHYPHDVSPGPDGLIFYADQRRGGVGIVDPKTGYGLTSRVQATVIAPDGLTSDPLSTAMTMLSEPARTSLMRNYRTSKVFVKIAL